MTDLAKDLINYLLTTSDRMVDVTSVYQSRCSQAIEFDENDLSLIRCRQNFNQTLKELRDMGWIIFNPPYGISTAHVMNHANMKRIFSMTEPVYAKLTTKGHVEYANYIKEATINNQTIGVNYGYANQSSTFLGGLGNSPINIPANTQTSANTTSSEKESWIYKVWKLCTENKLISGILTAIIIAALYFLLKDKIPFMKHLK